MRVPRSIGVAVLVVIVAAGVGPGASAKAGHPARPDLSTRHGVAKYLRSLGLNPAGFVIQRGARNYAGAKCPGKGWNCTKATRVVQIRTTGAGANVADCTGTEPVCSIVQTATTGGNTFTCNQQTPTADGLESCIIVQKTGVTKKAVNKNTASVTQSISQSGTSGTQTARQVAQITQNNDSGPNQITISQSINQSLDDPSLTISQIQSATQTFAVAQCAPSQTSTVTVPSGDPSDPSYPSCDTTAPPVMQGSVSSSVTQSVTQTANANAATAGSQFQESTIDGHVHQWTGSKATSSTSQTESQQLHALGSGVLQTQKGPMGVTPGKQPSRGRALAGGLGCCSNQGTNPSDTFSVTQSSSQSATNGATAAAVALAPFLASVQPNPNYHSDELQTAICAVSGTCSRTQNGTTVTGNGGNLPLLNFCSNGTCSDGQNIPTAVSSTGDTVPVSGGTVTVGAHLERSDTHVGLAGQDVTFTFDGTPATCTARTQTNGNASCTPTPALAPGSYTIHRSFAGAGPYEPSYEFPVATLIVFAYLDHGAFVISPATATWPSVTFFSAKSWSQLNPLTPSAPNSFQGFADTLSWTPPTCPSGGTWTLSGGNSPPPPTSVPSYMAVLATTSVSKMGSAITGTVTQIVVVQTTGYSVVSGTGTGTVVRVAC